MGPDHYKVEVLHYINPHLIWVLVQQEGENDFFFDQIGIYGILPQKITFDFDGEEIREPCEQWLPAAGMAMMKVLYDAEEVWFSPTYIDKNASIFDDNNHKYGDLVIIKKNGTHINLVDEIINSRFAYKDECLFHQRLRDNNLSTKLDYVTTLQVIKNIEGAYNTRDIPEQLWQKTLKNQTSVFQEFKKLEATRLSSRGVEINDRYDLENLLKNKFNDLKLCKDIDEESAGRASSMRSSRPSSMLSVGLRKKLEILKAQKMKVETKLDDNKIPFNFESKSNGITSEDELDSNKVSPVKHKSDFSEDNNNNFKKKPGNIPSQNIPQTTRVAYGPEGLQHNKFNVKTVINHIQETEEPTVKEKTIQKIETEEEVKEERDVYDNTDSKVNIQISNIDILNKINFEHSVDNKSKIDNKGEKLSPMMRKIRYLEEKKSKINDISTSTSDKDSSKCGMDSDTESVTALVENISLSNTMKKDVKPEPIPNTFNTTEEKINVNPFKNIDGSISIFVEKLVSPILMVHTKKNNRIQPVSNMRDIPFGNDIHTALKNMEIKHPMRPQTISWPTILRGHSFFQIGPSSSGGTMGYLPAVCRLVYDFKNTPDNFGLSSIIVCATSRSVAAVEDACKMFLHREKIFSCYAGISDMKITTSLLNGCDLLICTPPMLVRLIQEDFSLDFRSLSTIVIDDCEHIAKVYPNELKFIFFKVREIVKKRINKEWKIQYIIVSRIWCDFMSSLAQKAPDSVISISAFEECVLYSKATTSVEFVKENKLTAVINFLKGIDGSKKTVIVCRADEEVKLLEKTLTKLKYIVFACDNTMTVQDLYNIDKTLKDYEEPVSGPILVCCDGNLTHMNVTDAHYLVHYSLPVLFSMFCKRFAVLIDNYPSIFKDEKCNVKIKILLDVNNVEQLPKILHFIKRCTQDLPPFLDEISTSVLSEKDLKKAQNLVPICTRLLSLGKCPDYWNCEERHAIFKEYDVPHDWLPKEGVINFQILHYNSAVNYSARIKSCVSKGNTTTYPQDYSLLSIKMGRYYSKEANRRLHGIPKVGDVCAVSMKQSLFVRCKVLKVITFKRGQPSLILIKLIDEEKYETVHDTWLYHLPDELKNVETHVVRVMLANLMPQDKDVTFSKLAEYQLKKITEEGDDLYMRGRIAMTVGNIILVDTLEACQDLCSLEEVVVKYDFRKELLDGHALPYPDHIYSLRKLCDYNYHPKKEVQCIETPKPIKILPKGRWAHLESDGFSQVLFISAKNPCEFFVRPLKFDKCLTNLIKDIEKYVSENPEPVENINVGEVVLAEFPDDATYERARIDDNIKNNKVRCFFVDQGEWRDVSIKKVLPITEKFITVLPFQAIECRLIGIQPLGDDWTDFSTNFFVDSCFDSVDKLKQLYTKYFTKEKSKFTEGHKYGVVLIDTYSDDDVVINQVMLDKNLAEENEEIEYLSTLEFERDSTEFSGSDSEMDELKTMTTTVVDSNNKNNADIDNELSKMEAAVADYNKNKPKLGNVLSNVVLRSVPLIDSDDSLDNFDFVTDSSGNIGSIPITKVVAIDEVPETESKKSPMENTQLKSQNVNSNQVSKPKILWRQNNRTVIIKIQLIADDYDLTIKERHIKFSADANDTKYGFDFELFGVVDLNKCSHSNKGQYIQVNLFKLMARNWLTLSRDGALKKWIAYDIEGMNVSSDDESVKDSLDVRKHIIHTYEESDSDFDLQDDINFSYKRE